MEPLCDATDPLCDKPASDISYPTWSKYYFG